MAAMYGIDSSTASTPSIPSRGSLCERGKAGRRDLQTLIIDVQTKQAVESSHVREAGVGHCSAQVQEVRPASGDVS